MGNTYTVPRSAKGESRILYIFTIKSLAITLVFAMVGWGVGYLINSLISLGLVGILFFIGLFGGLGYFIGAGKIPDSPLMGSFQKAGGEQVTEILMRFITFKSKKKLYVYGITRESKTNAPSTVKKDESSGFEKMLGIKK